MRTPSSTTFSLTVRSSSPRAASTLPQRSAADTESIRSPCRAPIPSSTAITENRIEDICNNETIDQSGPAFAALQQQYQQATTHAPTAANGDFVGNTLAIPTAVGYAGYAPNFKTAYATQINIGLQREFWRGSVLSVDYLHSVTNHIMQAIDTNHIGDARYFDKNAAAAAIQATLSTNGWANIDDAIDNGATIADFASNGLDSSIQENSGYPQPGFFAFSGINPLVRPGVVPVPKWTQRL